MVKSFWVILVRGNFLFHSTDNTGILLAVVI